jgi:hypothetical protein
LLTLNYSDFVPQGVLLRPSLRSLRSQGEVGLPCAE